MKKKIAVIANELGIIYKFRYELIQELLINYEVFLISPIEEEQKFYYNELKKIGVNIIETKLERRSKNPFKEIKILKIYNQLLKKIKPDIVLTYTIKPNVYGSLICQKLKIPYINTITGVGTGFQSDSLTKKIVVLLNKVALKKSNKIFFQNEHNLNIFLNNKIVDLEKVKLVNGSGVNLKKFKPMIKEKDKDKTVFLFIGRIMDEKGLKEYLETAKNIKEKYKNSVEFQILGAYEEEKYRVLIEDLEKKYIIRYLGVSKDIREQVKNVDCVVNPSWHEGMSNVLLEAGAMKKLLIASDIPGCNEIVINDKTGLTFEVKNQKDLEKQVLKYLDLSQDIKEKIISNCYEHIKNKFSREKVVEEYIKVIQEGGKNVK